MKSIIRTIAIAVLLLCAPAIMGQHASAQDSNASAIERGGLTEGLMSRNQLRRLLDQPQGNQNPLRRRISRPQVADPLPASTLPLPTQPRIQDSNVRGVSWQEEPQNATSQPAPVTDNTTADEKPVQTYGPEPSPEMLNRWQEMVMLAEIPVNKLLREIEERRARIDASVGMDSESKTARLKQLEIAEVAAHQANQHVSGKDKYQNDITSLERDLEALREKARSSSEPPTPDDSAAVDQIQTKLRNLQADLGRQQTDLRKTLSYIQQRDDRMTAIPSELLESRSNVNEFHKELLQKQATGSHEVEELLSLRARELAASTKVQLLDEEAHWYDLSQEKLPLEKSIYQRNIQRLEQEIDAWNDLLAKQKKIELERQIAEARKKAWQAHPALKEFSQRTTELAQARVELAAKFDKLQDENLKVEKQKREVEQHLARLEAHEESLLQGGNEQSNNAIIEVHRNLIRPWESMARIRILDSRLIENRGTKQTLLEQLDLISDPTTFINEHLEIVNDEPVANTTLFAMSETAIESHREQLVASVGEYERVLKLINQIKTNREGMLKQIAATRKLIDTHALWVQSADPLNMQVLHQSRDGAVEFFDQEEWDQLGKSIVSHVKRRPWEPAIGMLGLFVTFVVGRRFKG